MAASTALRRRLCLGILVVCLSASCGSTAAAPAPAAGTVEPLAAGSCRYVRVGPDPLCTPGQVWARASQTALCQAGSPGGQAPLTVAQARGLERELLVAYGDRAPADAYRLDHLIPVQLGGDALAVRNLWPQPWEHDSEHPEGFAPPGQGGQTKDRVARELLRRVCSPADATDHLLLIQAQAAVAQDWYALAVRWCMTSSLDTSSCGT